MARSWEWDKAISRWREIRRGKSVGFRGVRVVRARRKYCQQVFCYSARDETQGLDFEAKRKW